MNLRGPDEPLGANSRAGSPVEWAGRLGEAASRAEEAYGRRRTEQRPQLGPAAMNVLTSFPGVKTRLLALVAFIIVPVALITIVLAWAAHQSLSSGIDTQWRQTSGEYVARTRVWLRGAARTLFASAASAASEAQDGGRCDAMLHDVVAANVGYEAISVNFDDGRSCVGAGTPRTRASRRRGQSAIALQAQSRDRPRHIARGGSFWRSGSKHSGYSGRCAHSSEPDMDRDGAPRSGVARGRVRVQSRHAAISSR